MNRAKNILAAGIAAAAVAGGAIVFSVPTERGALCTRQPADGGFCRARLADGRVVPFGDQVINADAGVGQCATPFPCQEGTP